MNLGSAHSLHDGACKCVILTFLTQIPIVKILIAYTNVE